MSGMSTRSQGSESVGFLRYLRPVAVSVGIGVLSCAILLLLMSLLMTVQNIPQGAIDPMASFALAVGGFVSGLCCAKIIRHNGLAFGAVCGLVLTLIVWVAGFALKDNSFGIPALLKAAFILLSAMLGGVLGVNAKRRRLR